MRFGLGSFAYRWSIGRPYYKIRNPMTIEQFMDRAVFHRVDGIMLCNNFKLEKFDDSTLWEARKKFENSGMFIETGARGSSAEYFIALLEASRKLGSRTLRIVTDIDRDVSYDQIKFQLNETKKYLGTVLCKARELGIVLALENYFGIHIEELVQIISYFDDYYLGACVDTANSAIIMENPEYVARELAPFARTAHFKDFKIEMNPRGNRMTGVPLGDGIVDFKKILEIFKENKFDGKITLELYIDRMEIEEETFQWEEECVSKSIEYARTGLGLLRNRF